MKPAEQIQQLEKEKAQLQEQVNGLLKRVHELEQARPKSKSRQQAEEGLKMLELAQMAGVSKEQLAKLNPKYPSDVCYYIKNILKINVHRVKTAAGSVYMLDRFFEAYQAAQAKTKAEQKEAAKDAKEEIQAETIPQSTSVGAAAVAV